MYTTIIVAGVVTEVCAPKVGGLGYPAVTIDTGTVITRLPVSEKTLPIWGRHIGQKVSLEINIREQ